MTSNIIDFMENVQMLNKEVSLYEDRESGIIFPIGTAALLCKVERLDLTNEEKKAKEFQLEIEKIETEKVETTRPVNKYDITKNEKDKNVLVDSKVMVNRLWNVSNQLGVKKTFNNKEDAIKLCDEINKKVFKVIGI